MDFPKEFDPTYDRARWIADLRSGRFKQGEGAMRTPGLQSDGFCCLGVAGYSAGLPMTGDQCTTNFAVAQDPDDETAIANAAKLKAQLGLKMTAGLAHLNDSGLFPFSVIADLLEAGAEPSSSFEAEAMTDAARGTQSGDA